MERRSNIRNMTDPDNRVVGADRVLAVLAELARHPQGVGLDDMARAMSG
jgi:hypothetical protein